MISTLKLCRLDQGRREPYSENRPKGKEVGSTRHRRGPRLGPRGRRHAFRGEGSGGLRVGGTLLSGDRARKGFRGGRT